MSRKFENSPELQLPFGRNLSELMKQQGLALKNVAYMAGVSISVVQGWLTGSSPRDLWAVFRLSKELGVSFQNLLFGNSSEGKSNELPQWISLNVNHVEQESFLDAEIILDHGKKVCCFSRELPSLFSIDLTEVTETDKLLLLISQKFRDPGFLLETLSDVVRSCKEGQLIEKSHETIDGRILHIKIEKMHSGGSSSGGIAIRFRDVTRKHSKSMWAELYHEIAVLLSNHKDEHAISSVLNAVCKAKGFLCGEFWSIDQAGRLLTLQTHWSADARTHQFIEAGRNLDLPRGVDLPGVTFEADSVQTISLLDDSTSFLRASIAKLSSITGAIAVPVVSETTRIGVLCFYFGQGWTPRPNMTERLETLGIQIAKHIIRKAEYCQKIEALRIRAAILDDLLDGVLVVDREYKVVECNRSAEKLLHSALNRVVGRCVSDLLPDQACSLISQSGQTGKPTSGIVIYKGVPFEILVRQIDGSSSRALSVFFRALRSDQVVSLDLHRPVVSNGIPLEDYRLLFDFAPSPILVLSPDFRMLAANFARFKSTMTNSDVIGKNLFEVFTDDPSDPSATGITNLRASLNRVMKTRSSDQMEIQKYSIKRPDSQGGGFEVRYWNPINVPVLDSQGEVKYIIHHAVDVTEWVSQNEGSRFRESPFALSAEVGQASESDPAPRDSQNKIVSFRAKRSR